VPILTLVRSAQSWIGSIKDSNISKVVLVSRMQRLVAGELDLKIAPLALSCSPERRRALHFGGTSTVVLPTL
jgi:hypothetical protein